MCFVASQASVLELCEGHISSIYALEAAGGSRCDRFSVCCRVDSVEDRLVRGSSWNFQQDFQGSHLTLIDFLPLGVCRCYPGHRAVVENGKDEGVYQLAHQSVISSV